MNLISTFRQKIAPELNHLYTVPPFEAKGGADCGWFCREHALHVFFVALLFGAAVDIRRGDFLICAPPYVMLTSLDTDTDHAWCSLNEILPLDLSMTFQHFGDCPQLHAPIAGTGRNGPYAIIYSTDESAARAATPGTVHFIERAVISLTPSDLLADPYRFLHPPLPDDQFSWDRLYGPEIYARISLHCFRIATRSVKPLYRTHDSKAAVELISSAYPNATDEIVRLLNRKV